jgi:predicted thioesterase
MSIHRVAVFFTQSMISDMEYQIRDMILEHLPQGQDSVGVRVEFNHTAATLIGQEVTIETTVAEVSGRKIVSTCTIQDKLGVLGAGIHTRFICDNDVMSKRLKERFDELQSLED